MAKLSVTIIGDAASFNAAMADAAASAEGFSGKIQSVGASVTDLGKKLTLGLTVPLAVVGGIATKMASDFQSSMELIHTQAGVSQTAVDSLSKSVLALAGPTATAPDTLSAGLYHLTSQGLRGSQALTALKAAAEGAKIGQADLEDVTNALGATIVSKIAGVTSYGQAMGVLNKIVGSGDMRMQDLANAMGTGLPASAAIFGVSLQAVGGALATFGDNNIRGAKAGTLLNSALRIMAAPSTTAQKALATVGLGATSLANDLRQGGLIQAVTDLKTRMDAAGLSASQQGVLLTEAFGGKQANGVKILLDQLDRLKTKTKEVGGAGSQFGQDWKSYTQTASYSFDQFKASLEAAGITIGNVLLPNVVKIVQFLAKLADAFSTLSPATQTMIVAGAAIAAALGPVIAIVGSLVTVIGLLLTPIGLVVAGIALLAGGMALAVLAPQKLQDALEKLGLSANASKEVVTDLQTAWADLKLAGQDLANAVQQHWAQIQSVIQDVGQIVTGVVGVLEAVWREFGSNITTAAENAWTLVKATIQNALDVIQGIVEVFAGLLHGNWGEVWDGLKEIVSAALNQVVAEAKYALAQLADLASVVKKALDVAVVQPLKALATDAYHAALDVGHQVEQGVLDGLKDLEGAFESKMQSALSFLHHPHLSDPPYNVARDEIGVQIVQGVIDGLTGLQNGVQQKLSSQMHGALDQATPLITQAAKLLGVSATKSIVDGVAGVQESTGQQLRSALEQAMAPALAEEASSGAIAAAAKVLGESAAQNVVNGVVGKTPSMTEQIKTALTQAVTQAQQQAASAVQSASSTFSSSFGTVASGILSAFSSQTGSFVAPAQKQLNAEQLQDQVAQYASAVQSAQATLATDNQALSQALAGGDPDTIAAAQAQVLSDQQAYNAAVRAQQEFQLSQLAAKQTAAYDTARAKQEESLAQRLHNLQVELTKEPDQWNTMTASVDKILKDYNVQLTTSGQKFVDSFAGGITSEIPQAVAAAKAMAQAVADYTKLGSPAKLGPLASLDSWWTPFTPTLLSGLNVGALTGAVSSALTVPAAVGVGGGSRGGDTYQFNFPNYLGDKTDLVNAVSDAVVKAKRSGHPTWRNVQGLGG